MVELSDKEFRWLVEEEVSAVGWCGQCSRDFGLEESYRCSECGVYFCYDCIYDRDQRVLICPVCRVVIEENVEGNSE